jgi:hypothetical protein
MKYLKRFNENDSELSIEDWCDKFNITNYDIVNGLVNVDQNVVMSIKELEKIPIQFGIVNGSFACNHNQLTSLKGSPSKVFSGFMCFDNILTTLEGCPNEVGGRFDCSKNELTSLKYCSDTIGSDLHCSGNILTTLDGSPRKINGHFSCTNNRLTSLKGGPEKVDFDFNCSVNILTSLEGSPIEVGEDFACIGNKLTSLEGCPEKVGGVFHCTFNPIHEVFRIFKTYDRYQASMDYKYLRGTDIVRGRFKKACEDAEIKMPKYIKGYKYIDL